MDKKWSWGESMVKYATKCPWTKMKKKWDSF